MYCFSQVARRVLIHGARGERGARGVLVGAGGTGKRGEGGGGGRGKSPALSVFIMIRDTAMLWHHVSLRTVTPHFALPPPR